MKSKKNKTKTNKCTFCDKEIADGKGIYLDESGIDGVFCDNGICAKSYVRETVEMVDKKR